MAQRANLMSIATAVPPFCFEQADVAEAAQRLFAESQQERDQVARVFKNSGITQRYAVRPFEWYFSPLGWPERTAAFLEGGCQLFVDVARKALEAAGISADAVDSVVAVSSTGIATPGLEARVAQQIGFRANIERIPIFGLGCAGGVSGMAIASRLAEARPGSLVLLVVVELCSLAFRSDESTKANMVASALFSDGAAACVLRAGAQGIAEIEMSGQHLWPDTIDIMGWSVDPQGLGVIFDRAIPPFAEANMAPAVRDILDHAGLTMDDIDRFTFHPGGTRVLRALERSFGLGQGALDHERAILADYGNMSAPTALFVLERVIRGGLPARLLLTAMGPGFTASAVALKAAA